MNTIRKARHAVVLLGLLTLAACNTVQGAGQDLESIGKKGEEVLKD